MIEIQEFNKSPNLISFSFHIKEYVGEIASILLRKYIHRFYPINNAYAIYCDKVEILSNEKLLSMLSEFDISTKNHKIDAVKLDSHYTITSKMLSKNNKLDKPIYQSDEPFSFEFLFKIDDNIITLKDLSAIEGDKKYNIFIPKSKIWNVMYSVEHGFQSKDKEPLDRVNFEISGSVEEIDVNLMISQFREWVKINI